MAIEGMDFESQFSVGETKALLAPLFGKAAEDLHGYVVIYLGSNPQATEIGIVASDEHPACRMRLLARCIELMASEIEDA